MTIFNFLICKRKSIFLQRYDIQSFFLMRKVTTTLFLLWEIIAWFVIWLAPIIVPLLFTHYLFIVYFSISYSNFDTISYWWILILPLYIFFIHVSSLSFADIKNALPWIVLFVFIKVPEQIIFLLLVNLALMSVILIFSLLVNLIIRVFSK